MSGALAMVTTMLSEDFSLFFFHFSNKVMNDVLFAILIISSGCFLMGFSQFCFMNHILHVLHWHLYYESS